MGGYPLKETTAEKIFETLKTIVLILQNLLVSIIYLIVPKRRKSLQGEIALVTGAANGLGTEICWELASQGVKIVCWDIDKERNDKVVEELRNEGYSAWGYAIDISDPEQIETTSKKVLTQVGTVTIIVNNAALLPVEPILATKHSMVQKVFEVNVGSHFLILKKFLPHMVKVNRGSIVSISSVNGLFGNAFQSLYSSTKFAINGYMESLRYELAITAPQVHVMTVYPIAIDTRAASHYKCHMRFPSLTPVLDPKYIAKRVKDGLQRGDEYVYCPKFLQLAVSISSVLSFKMQWLIETFLMPKFFPNDDNFNYEYQLRNKIQ